MPEFSPFQIALMRAGTARVPFGQDPGLGGYLAEAQQQAAQQRVYDAQARQANYELSQRERVQKALENIDLNDPNAVAEIMKIEPALGIKLMQQQRLQREQQMMENYLGGGGGVGADGIAPYIMAASDNPLLKGLGAAGIADLENQRKIDAENRKKAAEEEKMRKQATIPNFELQEGVIPATADVSKAKQMLSDKESFLKTVDEMEKLFDKHGGVTETFNPTAAAEYRAKQKQLSLAAKGLFELGALQAPDIALISEMQIDPVGREAAYRIDPDAIKKSFGGIREFVNDKVGSRMNSLGYVPKNAPASKTGDLSSMTDEQLMQMLKELPE